MQEEEKPKGAQVGILIGSGAKGNRFTNVSISGAEHALINHGEENEFTNLEISEKAQPEIPKPEPDGAPNEHWYKKPVGILGLSIAGALLSAAALWAIAHYFS